MKEGSVHKVIAYFIALVWVLNGLFCKVLNLVPRHEQIVSRILGVEHARSLTVLIGISEIIMALWILSKVNPRLNAITQILIVALMNVLELIMVPDLLLWGHFNIIFADCFILLIYHNEFVLNKAITIKA